MTSSRDRNLNVRLSSGEIKRLREVAKDLGLSNPSDLIRHWIAETKPETSTAVDSKIPAYPRPTIYHRTALGSIYHGDSRGLLAQVLAEESVDLIMTSPPFALRRKKAYGNEAAHEYLDWFRSFAEGSKRVLKPSGSLVIDIGPAWLEGVPAKSLYQFELLVMLCEEYGFYLAQDFYWWNPSRMPAPAEWVNVRRLRVKDSVNPIWWLSPTPWPKASNKRVLTPYTKSQEDLFRRGYNAGPRPSGHVVSNAWGKDNGGAIPPNLIALPNTKSDDHYQKYCRENDIRPHPARFPPGLPEFFIRMLTDENDLVVDPFAGSCITGAVSEKLKRRWACCEIQYDYLDAAKSRFKRANLDDKSGTSESPSYRVPTPKPYVVSKTKIDRYGGKPPKIAKS